LLRALGVLGAPDPSNVMKMHLTRQRAVSPATNSTERPAEPSVIETLGETTVSSQADFYPSVAIRALTRML